VSVAGLSELAGYDPTAPLVASGNLRRRRVVNRFAEATATFAALCAVVVLGIVVAAVIKNGAPAITLDFLTKAPPLPGQTGGGIAPAIVGTALIIALATAIAMPLGVLIAIYMSEFAGPRTSGPLRLVLDLMNGLPSIVVGLFVFGLVVAGNHQSGFAASLALAIIMLPLIARASQEMLLLVPEDMRNAADALGVRRWRTVLGVVLPAALGGIVTGTVLAVARAAGETAPLILTCSIFTDKTSFGIFGHALPNIPIEIFTFSESPDASSVSRAWGAALVLLGFILLTNVGARALLARTQKRFSR
jgi:phosphate transport system permease protein